MISQNEEYEAGRQSPGNNHVKRLHLFVFLVAPPFRPQPPPEIVSILSRLPETYARPPSRQATCRRESKGPISFVFPAATEPPLPMERAAPAQLSRVQPPTENFSAENGHTSTPGLPAPPSRSIRTKTSGSRPPSRKCSFKFKHEGRVVMVFGRKQEASDYGTAPPKARQAASASPRWSVPPSHDVALGCCWQYFKSPGYINSRITQNRQGRQRLQVLGEPAISPDSSNTPQKQSRLIATRSHSAPTAANAESRFRHQGRKISRQFASMFP